MCCIVAFGAFFGPRIVIFLWWLLDQMRFSRAFDNFLLPFLGFLFFPWTTLFFVIVAPFGNVIGTDWLWLGIGVLLDLGSYGGGGYSRNKKKYE
ncbi:MAG: hypothetical protein ACOCXT_04490 [Candidatus Dojkabacteria bacterium]